MAKRKETEKIRFVGMETPTGEMQD